MVLADIFFDLLAYYELPFGKHGNGILNYAIRGWSIAPIVNISSGLPLKNLFGRGASMVSPNQIRLEDSHVPAVPFSMHREQLCFHP